MAQGRIVVLPKSFEILMGNMQLMSLLAENFVQRGVAEDVQKSLIGREDLPVVVDKGHAHHAVIEDGLQFIARDCQLSP